MGDRRVAVISDAAGYVGPSLARLLASTHDLVVGEPEEGLVDELEACGSSVAVADGVRDLSRVGATDRLVTTAIDRFGRLDAAIAFTGRIVVRRFLRSTLDDLREAMVSCLEAPTCSYAAWCRQWSIGVDDRSCCFARWEPSSSRDSTRCANAANRPPVSVRASPRRSCWSVAGRAAACPDDPLDPSARGLTSTGPSIESLAAASGPSRRRGSPGRDADHAGRVAPHVARTR